MTPAVSVILPVRNGGPFLAGAVQSILQQSLCDLELLLVDDHSDDGAVQALDLGDERVIMLKAAGHGVAAAFNAGLAEARGQFIARMDADDLSHPERLATQVRMLEQDPSLGIVGACVDFFAEEGVGEGNLLYRDWLNSLRTPQSIRHAMYIESPIPNPTALFRLEVIQSLQGYRDPEWPEDYDLYLRADAAGIRMAKPEGILLRWRDHDHRLTRTDARYSLQRFQQAKAHYLARNRLPQRRLLIWGAGPTGKRFYDLLAAEGIPVSGFIDVHPRRIGGLKRGQPVLPIEATADGDEFILVAVGARYARAEIQAHLDGLGRHEGSDYLFVA